MNKQATAPDEALITIKQWRETVITALQAGSAEFRTVVPAADVVIVEMQGSGKLIANRNS